MAKASILPTKYVVVISKDKRKSKLLSQAPQLTEAHTRREGRSPEREQFTCRCAALRVLREASLLQIEFAGDKH